MKITRAQLTRLQTVYAQMCAHTLGYSNTRDARMAWAAGILRTPVVSFSDLTLDQARVLIDAAQGELGHRAPLKAGTRPNRRPARSAEDRGLQDPSAQAQKPVARLPPQRRKVHRPHAQSFRPRLYGRWGSTGRNGYSLFRAPIT